ncbi:MAG: hypothetical protein H8E44_03265 [Planctomycetes bacterium]|nr:hypothetical protein [Planctomycetota bacterium]
MMNLGFHHATLSVFIVEEIEYVVERLLWVVQHVSECPALTILKKTLTGDDRSGHLSLQCVDLQCSGLQISHFQNSDLQTLYLDLLK